MKIISGFLCASLLLAGAAMAQEKHAQSPLTVAVKDANGKTVGTAVFSETKDHTVKLDLDIKGMSPGEHAFHIHQKPVCVSDDEFNTAGLRFDPTGEFYGNAEHHAHTGPSAGEGSVKVAANGAGHTTVVFAKLTFGNDDASIFHDGGTAIVFHSAPGDSGPTRIACGVISKPAEKSAKQ